MSRVRDEIIIGYNGLVGRVGSVRQWSGRPGFNPRLCHTKDFKNGTLYLLS